MSCNQKEKPKQRGDGPREIYEYPTDREFKMQTGELIKLETTDLNFKQITNRISSFQEETYGQLKVEFVDEKLKKRVLPYVYDEGLIKQKNVLRIKSDSILIDDGYSINKLKRILKRHYLNKGEIPYYSDSPRKALVEVTLDTSKNGKELKALLTTLTRTFDEIKEEINDTIELRVFFDYLRQTSTPMPPKMNEEE
ncbi:hypothetical protein [Winogradskyella arenosi]|uniref:Uncharacterized protein n=1 Tax=Winogradskyella arenosi TaxID=533325 RepID=A0A368ZG64_9FLAO|nr:hypothetical protein [Winogradskyella arenosi]RCW91323.1 hypothetical protein DFQ08_103151 [Winogradskyella arenosi]